MLLRILQIVTGLLLIPMFCLGLMAGLSGGGLNPAYQRIGGLMLWSPAVGILGLIVAELLHRFQLPTAALMAIFIPLLVWIGLLVWLQVETGFFF